MANHETVRENAPLRTLTPGERFCGWYLLKSAQTATTSGGKPYLSFRLADNSGELPAKLWDYAGPITSLDAGQAVWASGRVDSYQNQPQLVADNLRLADGTDEIDLSRIVPTAPRDAQRMLDYVEQTLRSLADADYRGVCLTLLERHREDFARLPGAMLLHHAFLHGLLMHTATMMHQADFFARLYSDIVDRDLLLAAAFLHDIGKLAEFSTSPLGLVSDYSKEGRLLGHLFLGAEEAGQAARELGVPEEKRLLLQHLIVSHHGKAEFGAIEPPKCAEAELLAQIDMIDSRMEMFRTAYLDTPAGEFSRQRIRGLDNQYIYRPAADDPA